MPRDDADAEETARIDSSGGTAAPHQDARDAGTAQGDPFRIVVAYDLSPDADRAVEVVASSAWPAASTIRVVTSSVGIGGGTSSFAGPRESRAQARELRAAIEAAHERIAGLLSRAGQIERLIVRGPPAAVVVHEARAFGADLIVAGARDRPPVAASLLGSVSTGIAEKASCPVLIVRVESIQRVVLATDGSPAAAAATAIVARWPLFAGSSVRVIGVATPRARYAGSLLPREQRWAIRGDDLATARAEAAMAVDRAVRELLAGGRRADGLVRDGNPADEIAAVARDWPADVIITGSSGKPLVHRLVLGSVARTVLQGVRCSVLVVRPGLRQAPGPQS